MAILHEFSYHYFLSILFFLSISRSLSIRLMKKQCGLRRFLHLQPIDWSFCLLDPQFNHFEDWLENPISNISIRAYHHIFSPKQFILINNTKIIHGYCPCPKNRRTRRLLNILASTTFSLLQFISLLNLLLI